MLEQQFPDTGETGPEVLARHLTEAGLPEQAIPYWRRAGTLAAGRSANLEAIGHLRQGLELVATLPDAPERRDEELALTLAIGGPLIATRGNAAPEVEATYSRAWALCEQLGRSDERFSVLRGLWTNHLVRGEPRRAHHLAERLVVLAEEQGPPLHRALARRALGSSLFFLGQLTDAMAALDESIAIDGAIAAREDPTHLLHYTERVGVAGRLFSGRALWFLGLPERALARVEAGLALAQRLAHPYSLAFAMTWVALLHTFRREFAAAQGRAEAAIDIARQHHMAEWLAQATGCRGFALVGLGQQMEGMAQLRTGLEAYNGLGCHMLDTQWLGFTAEGHLRAGRLDDALTALDRAAETTAATGERLYQAELYRLRGVILAQIGEGAEAAAWLQRAIDTARSQQAKSLELRAATSFARLSADQGRRIQAHDLLATVYDWFTEGFETADLKDAKALLDELK